MSNNTVILTHAGADFDAIASAFAASKLYPGSVVIHPGSTDINAQKIISLFSDILNFKKMRDLPKDFFENISRIIVVDTRLKNRIGNGVELLKKENVQIVVIDHHPGETDIENAIVINKNVGANTTILVNLLRLKKVRLTPIEATILALGIYEDTGSLSFPSVTSDDFKALEFLFSFGVDMKLIHRFTSPFLQEEQLNLLKTLLEKLKEYNLNGHKIGITYADLEKYIPGVSILAHKILEMIDLDVIFVLVKILDTVHIIGRSVNESFNLTEIADTFNGGGHPTAVSGILKGESIDKVTEKILEAVNLANFYSLKARDIMSSPVKTIRSNATIKDALEIMVKMGYSGLPVEENGEIIGIIEKKNVEKAYLFGKRNSSVKQFFSPKIVLVKAFDNLRDIEDKMVNEDVGRVLVEHNGRIVGIISRSDLLKAYKFEDMMKEIPRSIKTSQVPDKKYIAKVIENATSKDTLKLLKEFGKIASSLNIEIYLVGGAVRDALLGKKMVDFDFVTSDAVSLGKKLKEKFNGTIEIFEETQTVHFVFNNVNFDFVTARREYYIDKSLVPVIEKATLKEDLARRDFTINAMAVDIREKNFGILFDYFNGYDDLLKGIIRVLKPLSFIEDPSRIFRAIKYMIELGFKLSKETEILLKKAVEIGALFSSKSERVQEELRELIVKDEIDRVIQLFTNYGIIKELFRINNITKSTINAIKLFYKIEKNAIKRLYAFIFLTYLSKGNINEEEVNRIFGIKKNEILKMKEAMETFKNIRRTFKKEDLASVVLKLNRLELIYVQAYYYKAKGIIKKFLKDYLEKLRFIKNELKGSDLKELGLKEGPQYRKIFDLLTILRLKGEIKNKNDEIKYLLDHKEEFEWK
ncbi:MAG: CBS domain-containing protein [Caldisericum sp.]|uniref:CBS domain-containing protein n=1 Tax=Caldisericum sp. TaxID=2499687 RepID=UPI003D13E86F